MRRIDPIGSRRVKGIGVHETGNPLGIGLDCLLVCFFPRVLRVNHERGKPDTWDHACFSDPTGDAGHSGRELGVSIPGAVHDLVPVINLYNSFPKGVGIIFNRIDDIHYMSLINFSGTVIPTAPSINGPFIISCLVGDGHPAGPDIDIGFTILRNQQDFLTSPGFPWADQYPIHLGIGFETLVMYFNSTMSFSRSNRTDQKAFLSAGIDKQTYLIESTIHFRQGFRINMLHERSD